MDTTEIDLSKVCVMPTMYKTSKKLTLKHLFSNNCVVPQFMLS